MNFVKLPSGRIVNLDNIAHIAPRGQYSECNCVVVFSGDADMILNEADTAALMAYISLGAIDLSKVEAKS